MDINKEREAFESWAYSKKWNISRVRDHYVDDFVNGAWHGWQAKAQAVPDLGELQERIAGHQYYHDERGHMVVDMDDVVKEISGLDSWKAQAVLEGFVLVEKAKLMQIIGSVSMIEPITRGNPYMDSVKRELTAITDVVKTVIKAQEPTND